MSRACIDTHALIWHLSKPKRLGTRAARVLRDADAGRVEILVPAVVALELSLLQEAGRKVVGAPELHALLSAQPAFQLLPLDLKQALEFGLLRTLRDPFDRMVVAAARVAGVPLITANTTIHTSALVATIWD